jgi:hypothetical protein
MHAKRFLQAVWYGACREHYLTADKIRELLAALPARVIKKIQKISKETGETVEGIVERALDRYAVRTKPPMTGDDELALLFQSPKNRALFEKITAAMGKRSVAALTPEQRLKRATKGAAARAASMTPERRKEIAKASAQARWGRRDERLKTEESGSKKPPGAKQ